jgi:hypothetical protein
MRRCFVVPVLALAAMAAAALVPNGALAQDQLPEPPKGFQPPPPPPPAPVKPYQPVAITPAAPFNDPSFAAFRKNLADIAQRKDRAALAKLIVAQDFFWVQDSDMADKSKPGIDNLAKAIGLDGPDADGWDILTTDAGDPTLAELPQNRGLYCAPAPPTFDPAAFEALVEQTGTDPTEWGYPANSGIEVRDSAQPNAQAVEKLGLYFVRVLSDSAPPSLHIALPDGKTGFVASDSIVPLASDQICYTKEADGWKIAGYIGGGQ